MSFLSPIATFATFVQYIASGVGAVYRTATAKFSDSLNVADYGVTPSLTDATAKINAAILAAYNLKQFQFAQDETYTFKIVFGNCLDYNVAGPILIPSGIRLDLNGSRLIGTFAAASNNIYDNNQPSVIETGKVVGGALITNRNANSVTDRIVGSAICNGTIINANCGLNLINFQERSFVENVNFSNVSAAIRMTSCYYSGYRNIVVRNSCHAVNQYAFLLTGPDCSAMKFEKCFLIDVSVGISQNSNPSSGVEIDNCSFEGAYVSNGAGTVDGTGILFGAAAASAGWKIHNCYTEANRFGSVFQNGHGSYGISWENNFFTNTEYALQASAALNAIRVGQWVGNSTTDGGGIIRNLVDASASGNDLYVQIQMKAGQSPSTASSFLSNVALGNRGNIVTQSFWSDTAVANSNIARALPGLANKNALNDFAFEGANIVTKNLQVPFWQQTIANTTITLDSQIVYDESNWLPFHFVISDFVGGPYLYDGFIVGNVVYPAVAFAALKTLTVVNNGGNVQLVFGGLNTNGGASYAIKGFCRHA